MTPEEKAKLVKEITDEVMQMLEKPRQEKVE